MITTVGGIKGGGGKTTIATNLCVILSQFSEKVLLVDADEQRTSSDWVSQRNALGIPTKWTTILLSGKNIHYEVKKLAPHYDFIIIDVGGRDTTSQRAALSITHKCILPFKPKSFDMWTLGQITTLINEVKAFNSELQTYAVLNQADSRGPDNDDAMEIIKESSDFICVKKPIGLRKCFANAAAQGLGVVELKKSDSKAVDEIMALYSEVFAK